MLSLSKHPVGRPHRQTLRCAQGDNIDRLWLCLGAFFALTGMATGAFATHALRENAGAVQAFETASRYQIYHALALLLLAALAPHLGEGVQLTGWLFVLGIVLFSGSLYVLGLTGARLTVVVTPIGGVCLLAGWGWLLYQALRS